MTAPAISPAPDKDICVRCVRSVATERGKSVPYTGAPLCAGCAAVLAQDDERDRRCPDCQNWLDRYGRCLQCAEPAGEL